jgi:heme-degrading monooxygenase HmoA
MILEQAVLHIKPGEEAAFETAFRQAAPIIAGMPGCRSVDLLRCLERPDSYLLLVRWDRLEDHTDGFRRSPRY